MPAGVDVLPECFSATGPKSDQILQKAPRAAARLRAMELITILDRCHRFHGFVLSLRQLQSGPQEHRSLATATQGLRARVAFPPPVARSIPRVSARIGEVPGCSQPDPTRSRPHSMSVPAWLLLRLAQKHEKSVSSVQIGQPIASAAARIGQSSGSRSPSRSRAALSKSL